MDFDTLAIIAAGYFFAAFVKGATGLGFSTSALPLLTFAVGLKAALPLLIVPALSSNALVMIDAGHFRETLRRFWLLYAGVTIGIVCGLMLLARIDSVSAGGVLGLVLVAYGLFALANPDLNLSRHLEKPFAPAVGFLTGAVNGLTGSQVMPVLPYLMALQLDRNRFLQAINISFSLSTVLMAIGLSRIGLLTLESALISVGGLVPVMAGMKAGNTLRKRLSEAAFRRMVLILLIVFGVILIAKLFV